MQSKRGKGKKITHYGMNDFYRYYNKNHSYKIDRKIYAAIVSDMNIFIRENIIDTAIDFKLPASMGEIGIRKVKREPKIIDGKVVNNSPPDFKATLNLWEKNEEAKIKRIIIRHSNSHTNGYVYRVYYKKGKANYKNKSAYYFQPCRDFSRGINKRILDYTKNKYDSILLYKKN